MWPFLPRSSMLPFRTGWAQSAECHKRQTPAHCSGAREELAPIVVLKSLVRVYHHGVIQGRGPPWPPEVPRHRSPRHRGAPAEDYCPYHSRRSDRSTRVHPGISRLHLRTGPRVPGCSCSRLRNRRYPQCGLAVQSAFGPIPTTTMGLGTAPVQGISSVLLYRFELNDGPVG